MMTIRFAILAAAVALSSNAAAMAQPAAGSAHVAASPGAEAPVTASAVGMWIRDPQGNIVGSVRSLRGGAGTAEILVGSYFQNGSHVATVPLSTLSLVDGRVVLRTDSLMALNAPRR